MSQTVFSVNYKNLRELIREIVQTELNLLIDHQNLKPILAETKIGAKLDYLSLYNKYPKKLGKSEGLRVCKNTIKTPEALLAAHSAVDRYVAHLKANKIEPQFIKLFSTFMNSWEDWCDESTGTVIGTIKQRSTLEVVQDYERRLDESRRVLENDGQT